MNEEPEKNYWEGKPDEAPVDTEQTTQEQDAQSEQTEQVEQQTEQPAPLAATSSDNPVSWSASEYIHVEKNGLWYVLFALVVVGLIALDIFILKSYTFSALVVVMAIALIVYSRRPPRVMQYTLSSEQGLYVGERLHHFDEFKAFGLIKDGDHHSIMLIPTKRFAPGVSVYFPEEAGEDIVDILGTRLPMKPLKLDTIDIIVRTLRL